jgi:SAM-dependent methyltransferase
MPIIRMPSRAQGAPGHSFATDVSRYTDTTCIICHYKTRSHFLVRGYRLFVCKRCDYVFIDPTVARSLSSSSLFDDAYFTGGGAGYANYLAEGELLQAHGRRYGTLLAAAGVRDVLDVGAAAGFILRGLQEAGLRGAGIEPNATMAGFAVRELALDVRSTTLERFDECTRTFDAVVMLQVIDHVEDIRLAFERVARLTRSGGRCLIEFGNRASFTARLLRSAWHEYAPPSVQRVFSLRALERLLSDYGFRLNSTGRAEKYLRADHALALIEYKLGPRLGHAVVPHLARLMPPGARLRYPADDIVWAMFERT